RSARGWRVRHRSWSGLLLVCSSCRYATRSVRTIPCLVRTAPLHTLRSKGNLGEPGDLLLELGDGLGRDHQGTGVVDANCRKARDLLADEIGRADQVGDHLLRQ